MKWKSAQFGDRRIVRRFAWLPTRCEDEFTYWLCFFTQEEEYKPLRLSFHPDVITGGEWRPIRKLNVTTFTVPAPPDIVKPPKRNNA